MIRHQPEWPMFRHVWRRAELLERVTQELRVDAAQAARLDRGQAVRDARDRCLNCEHESECRDWLEAADGLPLPPSFCPNQVYFARCLSKSGRQEMP